MRIISQNGMDFPYEHIVVILDGCAVICRPISNMGGRYYHLGTYTSEERAEEVFRDINRHYKSIVNSGGCDSYKMPEE